MVFSFTTTRRAAPLIRFLPALLLLWLPLLGWGQVAITPGVTTNQDFNNIGATATATLPSGFRVGVTGTSTATVRAVGTFAGASTTTANTAGGGATNFTSSGTYNFGSGTNSTSTDRAIGALGSGSVSSATLFAQLQNTSATSAVSALTISYNVEKYRNGTNAAGFSVRLYFSTDGSTWTAAGSNFVSSFAGGDANNNSF
nr:hypothetical protein [Tanacetum cinerariifolium]